MKELLAALLLMQGGTEAKPTIDHIAAVGDTVWFEGAQTAPDRRRYCYVRRTDSWCRLPRAASPPTQQTDVPRSPGDSVAIGSGLTLVCRPFAGASECDTFGVITAEDRREHWLVPHITSASRDAMLRAIGLETADPPSMSTAVSAVAQTDDAVWFGLAGGFPEGEGAFGGLLRYDRARRTVETISHPRLANATVTALATYDHELWVGTAHPGEFGPWGSTGIMRRDLRTGRWARVDAATSPLPDNLIQTLAIADSVVCVATADGLAVYDPRQRRWAVRYFHRTTVADSIVYALSAVRPSAVRR